MKGKEWSCSWIYPSTFPREAARDKCWGVGEAEPERVRGEKQKQGCSLGDIVLAAVGSTGFQSSLSPGQCKAT